MKNRGVEFRSHKNSFIHSSHNYLKRILVDSTAGMMSRYLRHLIAGGIGTLLYITLVAICVEIVSIHPVNATIIATVLNACYTYTIQRKWVYNSNTSHLRSIPKFIIVAVIAILLNAIIMYLVVETFNWWYGFGIIFAAAVVPPTNFLLNYYWTYK
jgi:putative flippase GtrA